MKLHDYLLQQREDVPSWLERFTPGDPFPSEQFFASRVVFYPGSGFNGHPVKVFGGSHSAHSFVYADYHITQAILEAELEHPTQGFRGYHRLARLQLHERDLVPTGWTPHVRAGEVPSGRFQFASVAADPFGFLEILERDTNVDDSHGAQRLAILFLGADAIATYDALFCQGRGSPPPFAVLLQDHGFGGNYNRFGQGSLLEGIAKRCELMPQWLLVAEDTDPWDGFKRVSEVRWSSGGMHHNRRFLYRRSVES